MFGRSDHAAAAEAGYLLFRGLIWRPFGCPGPRSERMSFSLGHMFGV